MMPRRRCSSSHCWGGKVWMYVRAHAFAQLLLQKVVGYRVRVEGANCERKALSIYSFGSDNAQWFTANHQYIMVSPDASSAALQFQRASDSHHDPPHLVADGSFSHAVIMFGTNICLILNDRKVTDSADVDYVQPDQLTFSTVPAAPYINKCLLFKIQNTTADRYSLCTRLHGTAEDCDDDQKEHPILFVDGLGDWWTQGENLENTLSTENNDAGNVALSKWDKETGLYFKEIDVRFPTLKLEKTHIAQAGPSSRSCGVFIAEGWCLVHDEACDEH
eukprot:TRINITY_DN20517_c0_g1_i1.p1 TRINITY_DN20517_c0_g1~~TRINITY_DN20517_c0_g1_i1.p1  ORF type:complete len:276 (+),score=20.98 TRINITY_DN20517_c0_g1_i1:66-893(+)